MNKWKFDAVARMAADAMDRRSIFGLVTGAAVAAALRPFAGGAKDSKDKKKDRKQRKMCKRDFNECKSYSLNYCDTYYDPPLSEQCKSDTMVCCNYLKKCTRGNYRKANSCADQITW